MHRENLHSCLFKLEIAQIRGERMQKTCAKEMIIYPGGKKKKREVFFWGGEEEVGRRSPPLHSPLSASL